MADYNHKKFEETRYHSLWKSPNVKVFFSSQISVRVKYLPPEYKLAKQNWYMWYTFDVFYIHTKFHLPDMHGCWDTETAYFSYMLTLWPG